jgi:hypothetical protein
MVHMSEAPTQIITLTDPDAARPRAADPPDRRRRRRRWIAFVAVLLVLGAGAAAVALWPGRRGTETPAAAGPAVQSTPVVKQDLTTSLSLSGTLGFGAPRPVTGRGQGIVTWLPQPGAVIRRGQQVYRVDDRPVPLLYGGMPLFRTLRERNTVGRDVRIVADNLRALGYAVGRQPRAGERVFVQPAPAAAPPAPGTPPPAPTAVRVRRGEGTLTGSLITAIKRWQRDLGLPVTGAIGAADVVVQVAAVRVNAVAVQPGADAAAQLMSVTPTAKVISVPASPNEGAGIEAGEKVTVELPDGRTVPGKVTAVGTQVAPAESGPADGPAQLTVTVTVDDPKAVQRIDAAEVSVSFPGETRKGVLAVPVTALLALSEGGYAVQIAGGGLVAVETGMFAKGLVEVKGTGLAEGTAVVTTS